MDCHATIDAGGAPGKAAEFTLDRISAGFTGAGRPSWRDSRELRMTAQFGRIASAAIAALLGITLTEAHGVAAQEVAAGRVECTGDGKTLACRAVQQLFQRDTRQLVLAVLARKAPDPKGALIAIQMPLGLNLTEPIQIKVD